MINRNRRQSDQTTEYINTDMEELENVLFPVRLSLQWKPVCVDLAWNQQGEMYVDRKWYQLDYQYNVLHVSDVQKKKEISYTNISVNHAAECFPELLSQLPLSNRVWRIPHKQDVLLGQELGRFLLMLTSGFKGLRPSALIFHE